MNNKTKIDPQRLMAAILDTMANHLKEGAEVISFHALLDYAVGNEDQMTIKEAFQILQPMVDSNIGKTWLNQHGF